MARYKLIYFDSMGLAEIIRMLFHYAGVEFNDHRISYDDWPDLKKKMPYGQLPVLEIDGEKYSQSASIIRFLAREFGLTGKTSTHQLKADELTEACNDIMSVLRFKEEDEDKKAELLKIALVETVPAMLQKIETNMKGDFYAGEFTYADVVFAYGARHVLTLKPDMLDDTPKLKALVKRVYDLPRIKEYVEDY